MTLQIAKYSNFFETTLDGAVGASDTQLDLSAAPTDGASAIAAPFYLVVNPDSTTKREVILVTALSGTNMQTVTRDVEGRHSPDPTHDDGATVRMAVVGEMFEDLHDRINDVALTGDVTGTLASATQDVATTIAATAVHGSMLNTDAISAQTDLASGLALTDELLISDAGTLKKGDISLIADAIDGAGIDASAGTLVNAAIGKQSIWVPAAAMNPTDTNGCADIAKLDSGGNTGPDLYTLDFAGATANEHAQFAIAFPSYWNESTVTFKAYWTSEATDTDGVVWELKGVGLADSDSLNTAFGTGQHVDDANLGTAKDLHITAESSAITIAGSPAAGELCYFNIARLQDDGSDTAAEDAKLIGIKLFYTVDDVHEA